MTRYKIALATLAGIGIGAAAIHELHAQAKAPAYVVVAVRSIKDADAFKAGVMDKASPAVLAAAGGRYSYLGDEGNITPYFLIRVFLVGGPQHRAKVERRGQGSARA
jgi:hypothetical protein